MWARGAVFPYYDSKKDGGKVDNDGATAHRQTDNGGGKFCVDNVCVWVCMWKVCGRGNAAKRMIPVVVTVLK